MPDDHTTPEPWGPPLPFAGRATGPPLPMDSWPPTLREYVLAVAAHVQVAPEQVGPAFLSALSAWTASHYVVDPGNGRTDRQPVALWTMTVAPPSARKSPAYGYTGGLLWRVQDEVAATMAEGLMLARLARDDAERELARDDRLRDKDKRTADEDGALLTNEARAALMVKADAEVPERAVVVLSPDITPEALVRTIDEQGGRLALAASEGGAFLTTATGTDYATGRGGQPRLGGLLAAYDGEALSVTRIGRPPLVVTSPRLAVCLYVQPEVVDRVNAAGTLTGTGLAARMDWWVPEPLHLTDADPVEGPPMDPALAAWAVDLHRALARDWPDRPDEPHRLTLTDEARALYVDLMREVRRSANPGGCWHEPAAMREAAGKIASRALRVAGLLTVAAAMDPDLPGRVVPSTIPAGFMAAGVDYARASMDHLAALLGVGGAANAEAGERAVVALVRAARGKRYAEQVDALASWEACPVDKRPAHPPQVVVLSRDYVNAYRSGFSGDGDRRLTLGNADHAHAALDAVVAAGLARRGEQVPGVTGAGVALHPDLLLADPTGRSDAGRS